MSSNSTSNLLVADSLVQPYKSKRQPYELAKGAFFSFLALLLVSVFFYVSIFNLSLSALFNSSSFWFCISNTLVLIIAVDYGVFSPSKHKLDFYEDYVSKQTQTHLQNFPEQERKIVVDKERENPEEKLQIVVKGRDLQPRPSSEDRIIQQIKSPTRSYQRSKSEKGKRSASEESKTLARRTETVKYEENEFAKMTDEEVNRRVEEFIERFNKQMRLQAAASRRDETQLQPNISRLRD